MFLAFKNKNVLNVVERTSFFSLFPVAFFVVVSCRNDVTTGGWLVYKWINVFLDRECYACDFKTMKMQFIIIITINYLFIYPFDVTFSMLAKSGRSHE